MHNSSVRCKRTNDTSIYTQLIDPSDDEFVSKVAKTVDEACKLMEAGFDYVTDVNDVKIFRKRK